MNIQIEFVGFPMIYDLFPEGFHPYHLEGNTLADLIHDLTGRYNARVSEALLEGKNRALDPTIQIMINRRFIAKEQWAGQEIQEGDQITFLRLLAGG